MGGALGQSHSSRSVDVLKQWTVLHNRSDPLTSKGHHTKSPPLHLTDVDI